MIITEEEFLEHYGKKGMRWGQRTGKEKLKIVVGGYLGYATGGYIASRIIARRGLTPFSALPILGAAASGGYIGVKISKAILDKKGHTPYSKITKTNSPRDKAMAADVEKLIKK